MCGIVGAASRRNIVPVLVEGLKRLEYRGYDSCGVAVHQGGLRRARSTSRVAELEAQTLAEDISGGTGVNIVPERCTIQEDMSSHRKCADTTDNRAMRMIVAILRINWFMSAKATF